MMDLVKEICTIFKKAGKECYLVGGATRDMFLGNEPKDYDLATDATPEEGMKIFESAGHKTIPLGVEHGTIGVLLKDDKTKTPFEITTFRSEGEYSDGRHPDWVKFSETIEDDVMRRDFTINSITMNPLTGEVFDPFGGRGDLERGVIKTIGNPEDRFNEDALRIVRACRFSSRYGFEIEPETKKAMKKLVMRLGMISRERIRDEIIKIMGQSEKPSEGIGCMDEIGFLEMVLPEVTRMQGVEQKGDWHGDSDVWDHSINAMDCAPQEKPLIRFAALLHDTGKPEVQSWNEGQQRYNFYGHEAISSELAKDIMKRLKFSKKDRDKVSHLIARHMFKYSDDWTDKTLRKWINKVGMENLEDMLDLRNADVCGRPVVRTDNVSEQITQRLKDMEERLGYAEFSVKDLDINGHEVMQTLGIRPGPEVGKAMNYLVEMVLEEPCLNTKENLKDLLVKYNV